LKSISRWMVRTQAVAACALLPLAATAQVPGTAGGTQGNCPTGIVCKGGPGEDQILSHYVQDTLSAGSLTANIGLRYDTQARQGGNDSVDIGRAAPSPFPELSTSPLSSDNLAGGSPADWGTLVPRLGLSYSTSSTGKELLRSSYARFSDQLRSGSRPASATSTDANGFLGTGSIDHEFRFGFDYRTADTSSLSTWAGGGGVTLSENLGSPGLAYFYRPFAAEKQVDRISDFIGDTLTWGNLTANIGFRFDSPGGDDRIEVADRDSSLFPDLLPTLSFEGLEGRDRPFEWEQITPRVGLTYDLGRKTLLKASYARYADNLGLGSGFGGGLAGSPGGAPPPYVYTYTYAFDSGGSALPDAGLDPNLLYGPYAGFTGNLDPSAVDPDLTSPRTREMVIGGSNRFANDVVVGRNFTYRRRNETLWDIPLVVDAQGNTRAIQPNDWPGGCNTGGGVCNQLWGDYFYVDPGNAFAGGGTPGAPVDFGLPGNYDPIPDARNPLVQIMIIDQFGNVLVQVNVSDAPPVQAPAPVTLWSAVTRQFATATGSSGATLMPVSYSSSTPALTGTIGWGSGAGFLRAAPPPRARRMVTPPPVVQQANGLQLFLTNLGNSTGEAFVMQAFNAGPLPVEFTGEGIVVEPLKEAAQQQLQRLLQQQLGKLIGDSPVMQRLNAYCLEFLKAPPSLDSMFQIASGELQQQFAPLKQVLSASKALQDVGLLNPDSDPLGYFHSIRQWSIWTHEEGLDQQGFTDAFVEHTRKQLEATGREWSSDFDAVLRQAAPNRWNDIQRILTEAERRPAADGRE